LKERLPTFLRTVTCQPITVGEKPAMWRNALKHCQGDHTSCPFPQHKGYIWKPKDGQKDAVAQSDGNVTEQPLELAKVENGDPGGMSQSGCVGAEWLTGLARRAAREKVMMAK
jgi:hypothetical protein